MYPLSDPVSIPETTGISNAAYGSSSAALPDDPGAEMADFFGWNRLPTDEEMDVIFAEDCRRCEDASRPAAA